MKEDSEILLIKLFEKWSCEKAGEISLLPVSGSGRQYYRIKGGYKQAIGAVNNDKRENVAFVTLSQHFLKHGLNVPEVYAEKIEKNCYLLQDLGDITLYSYLTKKRNGFSHELISIYKDVLNELPKFQVTAGLDIDYSVCYPRSAFDGQSMRWDMNYFKYYFLKLADIQFDEQKLEDDFGNFTNYLLKANSDFFLYRDFQSRNIMLHNNRIFFIDYQGGRKGPLQYDLASLLYDAKALMPPNVREELLEYYINIVAEYTQINKQEFIQYFYGFVFIRIMQALGAYGFRGYYERKEHFLQSIPHAITNIEWLVNNVNLPVKLPALNKIFRQLISSGELRHITYVDNNLTVSIKSFSYKKSIPVDNSGDGGGYVFDCRALPNPGRYEEYKHLSGKNREVREFLEKEKEVHEFFNTVTRLVDQSVKKYIQRDFTHLSVCFGCTGGQHRSVYCAEKLAKHLLEKFKVSVNLDHTEQDNW